MAKAIRHLADLQNLAALGLDVWVVMIRDSRKPWQVAVPRITHGARGPMMDIGKTQPQYLNRLGIVDAGVHHTVHLYGHLQYKLFNTEAEALEWCAEQDRNRTKRR